MDLINTGKKVMGIVFFLLFKVAENIFIGTGLSLDSVPYVRTSLLCGTECYFGAIYLFRYQTYFHAGLDIFVTFLFYFDSVFFCLW